MSMLPQATASCMLALLTGCKRVQEGPVLRFISDSGEGLHFIIPKPKAHTAHRV